VDDYLSHLATLGPFIHAQSKDLRKCLWKSKIVLDSCWPSCFYTNCVSQGKCHSLQPFVSSERTLSESDQIFKSVTFSLMCSPSISVCELESIDRKLTHTHTHSLLACIQGIQCPLPAAIRPSASRQHVLTVIHSRSAALWGLDCNEIRRKSEFGFSVARVDLADAGFVPPECFNASALLDEFKPFESVLSTS